MGVKCKKCNFYKIGLLTVFGCEEAILSGSNIECKWKLNVEISKFHKIG